jgi:hypothetical protein
MTLEEYNKRLTDAVREVETSLGTTMVKLGNESLTLIRKRVQESGINAEGKGFAQYSQKPMLANCSSMTTSACSQIAGSKQKRRDLKWVTLQRGGKNIRLFEIAGGYKKFREIHGRQTDRTDFTFFGRLWGSMHILSNTSEHDGGLVTVGPNTEEEMKVLQGNVNKRGQILDLSPDEITQLASDFKLDTLQIMRNHGL